MLDLTLTDLGAKVQCEVLPHLADHKATLSRTKLEVPSTVDEKREYWLYNKADWNSLSKELQDADWDRKVFDEAFGKVQT